MFLNSPLDVRTFFSMAIAWSQKHLMRNTISANIQWIICYVLLIKDYRPPSRAVTVFRRNQKRSKVTKEENMAVPGLYDLL